MSLYAIALFLHVVGAMGLVATLALEWMAVARLRRAGAVEEVRDWLGILAPGRAVGPAFLVALLLAGVYLSAVRWGAVGWVVVGLGALVLYAGLAAYNGIPLAGVGREVAAGPGPLPPALGARLGDPLFVASVRSRAALLAGAVFLMTLKLDLDGSLATAGIALALGLASAYPAWRARPGPSPRGGVR